MGQEVSVTNTEQLQQALKEGVPFSYHENFTSLELSGTSLTPEDTFRALEALVESKVSTVKLDNLNLDFSRFKLSELLSINTPVESLSLSCCSLGPSESASIISGMKGNTILTSLDISENEIGMEGMLQLSEVLSEKSSKLRSLNLSKIIFSFEDILILSKGLVENSSLCHLFLHQCNICQDSYVQLLKALRNKKQLVTLGLSGNSLGVESSEELATFLSESSVQILGLNNISMASVECSRLARGLQANKTLKILFLKNNKLTGSNLESICSSLTNHPNLQELYLGNCSISDDECPAIAYLLKNNNSLLLVELSGNPIEEKGLLILKEASQKETPIELKIETPVDIDKEEIETPVDIDKEKIETPDDIDNGKIETPVNIDKEKIETPVDIDKG